MLRPLVRFAVPYVAGVLVCQYFLPDEGQLFAAAVAALLGLILSCLWKKRRGEIILSCVGFCIGILWLSIYGAIYLAPNETLVGTEQTLTLELTAYPEKTVQGARCTARAEGIRGRILYYGDDSLLELGPGDRLSGELKCYSAAEVGGKRSTAYTSKGIFLRLYPKGEMTTEEGDGDSLRYFPQWLNHRVTLTVKTVFDEDTQGMILALLTGERESLGEQNESDLEESGLIHLAAVSGLHCGFLITLVSYLLGRNLRLTALVGYPILVICTISVGCTPSVVRACIMVGFTLAAPLCGRENDPPTALASAAMMILMCDPYAIGSVSFQLSFAAVIGLYCVTPRVFRALNRLVRWKNRLMRSAWEFVAASVSCTLGALAFTVPISAYCFKTISLVAPLSNLMALFVVQALFACAVVVTLLCAVLPVLAPLAAVPAFLAKYVLWVAGFTAKLPGHAVSFDGILSILWLVYVYVMLLVCAVSRDRGRKYALAAVLAALTLSAVRLIPIKTVEDDGMTMVAVDVGQGAATLIHSGGETALVDCGSYYSPRGSGADVVDAMDTYGWESLQYAILTHYHRDHAGGLSQLLARTRVETLLLPWETESELQNEVLTLAQRYGVAVRYIYMTNRVRLGDAILTIYPQLTRGEINEEGLTVVGSYGEFDALITGDMGMSTERMLIEKYDLCDVEVLFVAHHGSKYSTSEEFLKEVTPEIGIISVGENGYGHPSAEAMERMAFYGMELYRTDWQGNILIQIHR